MSCGVKLAKRIVGGQVADPGEWRWHVQLHEHGKQFCSGSLITAQWVITSAHCVDLWFNSLTIRLT